MGVIAVTPEGHKLTYHRGNHIKWNHGGGVAIYSGDPDAGGHFIARVPPGSAIGFQDPTLVTNARTGSAESLSSALELALHTCDQLKGWNDVRNLVKLKRKLRRFDARKRRWA